MRRIFWARKDGVYESTGSGWKRLSIDASRIWRLRYAWRFFSVRRAILDRVIALANALERRWFPVEPLKDQGGKLLGFKQTGWNLGHAVLSVYSLRGGFDLGRIEWSNQWGRARFKPHHEAVFDQQCVAEIYAAMRDLK